MKKAFIEQVNKILPMLDYVIQSSGEPWGTFFLTPQGVIDQVAEKISKEHDSYLKDVYIPKITGTQLSWRM